jgi:succinoglycan biosynthesis transport protein ExoP
VRSQHDALRVRGVKMTNFDLRRFLQVVRRRVWIVVLCAVLVPAAAVAVSATQQKKYTAEATLLFRDPQFDQKLFGSTFVPNSTDPERQAATNLELVSLETVAARAAKRFPGVTPKQVSDAVEPETKGQADVVSIKATWTDRRRAAALANTVANEYIAFRRDADRAKIGVARLPLRRQLRDLSREERAGPLGRSLRARLTQLNVLASLQTGNAELVQPALVPDGPSSPKVVRNGALGLVLGLILGAGLVGLAEALDRRLRDPSEIEHAFDAPVLAGIPESPWLKKADAAMSNAPPGQREAFDMLRANLRYFNLNRAIESVLITSAESGEGKSTVAWGLAVAAARTGTRTLLVEADLRRPTFASQFQLDAPGGLTTVLTGRTQPADAVQSIPLAQVVDGTSPESLCVLLAGPIPPNPTAVAESDQMARLLEDAKRDYDLVVIDTPPITLVPDAIPLMRRVDGVIVVSRLGTSSRGPMHRLAHQLENLDAPVLGVVLNSANENDPYAYGYAYGYGDRPHQTNRATADPGRSGPSAATGDRAAPSGGEPGESDTPPRTEPERPSDARAAPAPGETPEGSTTPAPADISRPGAARNGSSPRRSPAGLKRLRDLLR